jgi:hypothetical protein
MALFHSPSIVTSNLVLCLDSANPKSWSQNLFPYPLDIGAWATSGNACTLSRDTTVTDSPTGGVPLKMAVTGNDPYTNTYNAPVWNLAPSTTTETWTVSCWVKASVATNVEGPVIFGSKADGTYITASSAGSINVYTYWTRISFTVAFTNAAPLTTNMQLRLDGPNSGGTGQTIWWDGLQVERSTSATPFNSKTNTNGTNFYDLSALRSTITTFNYPSYVAGPVAYTAYNGSTQYLQYSPTTQFGNTDFSIEFVLKVSATSANYGIMLWGSGPFNSLGKGIEVRFQTNGFEYTVNDGVGAGTRLQYNGITSIADGAWRHFVITQVRAGTATLYINGVSVGTQSYSGEVTFTDLLALQIGKGHDGYLNGQIPLFKMYNAALSAADVQKNFSAVRGRFSL